MVHDHVAGEQVIHVTAMVEHEHEAGARVDVEKALLVGVYDTDPIGQPHEPSRDPVADTEVHVGIERRADLGGVVTDPVHRDAARDALVFGPAVGGFQHLGVVAQAIDQDLPAVELERPHSNAKPPVHFVDCLIDLASEEPTYARHEHALERHPAGENQ